MSKIGGYKVQFARERYPVVLREESQPPRLRFVYPHYLFISKHEVYFHHVYLDTDWVVHKVAFMGIDVLFMEDIPVHGIMEKLHLYYPERHNELVEMLSIDLI